MEIAFAPEIEQFIREQIQNGRYASPSEVIFAGLQLLKEREQTYKGRFEELQRDVAIGLEASERGEVVDADVVFQSLQAKLQQRRDQAEQ